MNEAYGSISKFTTSEYSATDIVAVESRRLAIPLLQFEFLRKYTSKIDQIQPRLWNYGDAIGRTCTYFGVYATETSKGRMKAMIVACIILESLFLIYATAIAIFPGIDLYPVGHLALPTIVLLILSLVK